MGDNIYITVAEYVAFYDLTPTPAELAIYETLIEAASRRIDRFCGRVFYVASEEEYFDGNARNVYFTRKRPILGVTLLERIAYDADGVASVADTIAGGGFHIYPHRIELSEWPSSGSELTGSGSTFRLGQLNYRITYTHGASVVPADVKTACAMFTNYFINGNTLKSGGAYESERIGNYMYELGDMDNQLDRLGMPGDVKAILGGYRKMRIGGLGGG